MFKVAICDFKIRILILGKEELWEILQNYNP